MKELSIEELALRWDWLRFEVCTDLRITEQFPKRGCISYVVSGLSMEFEDIFAFCSDNEEKLIEHYSVLMIFLKDSLTSIQLLPIGENLFQERLLFNNDGVIVIERAS